MTQEPKTTKMAVSMGREDGTSAIYIDGKLAQKYDHNAVSPPPARQQRKISFSKAHALRGPKLKVERAKKHIAELEAALTAFAQSNPYSLVPDTDPQTGQQIWRVAINKPIPEEISVIIGDAVHNLRAALDYIVCDLVRINNAAVPDAQRDPSKTSAGFPIDKIAKKHKPGAIGKIQGIPARAERLVLRLKAHKGWNNQAWRLHFLDIRDKHNLIVTVAGATVQVSTQAWMPFFFQGPDGGLRIGGPGPDGRPIKTPVGVPSTFKRVFPMYDGVEVHRTTPPIQEDINVAAEVAFGQGEIAEGDPVLITLQQFAELVERTIALFERVA